MYRTLLVVALSSIFSLSHAADKQDTADEANAAQPFSAPAHATAKKSKRSKIKQPVRTTRSQPTPPKVAVSPEVVTPKTPTFVLASEDILPNNPIPQRFESDDFGCMGENSSPELHWTGAPAETKSFAVTVYDPDAPSGSGWWHWMLYDLPADTDRLDPGVGTLNSSNLPGHAMQALSDYGVAAWGGTCPPVGDKAHRYVFTVHALKVDQLDIPDHATPAMVGYIIHANTLETASFNAHYGRSK